MLVALYKFVSLPDDVKANHKIKSKARLDCVSHSGRLSGGYKGLTNFVNSKGQLFLYKTPCRDFVSSDIKRMAEWALTNTINGQTINFSSIYIEDMDCQEIGYGYSNPNRLLSNGKPNPQFEFRNDGYLFLVNTDYTEIDVLVISDGRNLISSYYQKMIDGGFADELLALREQARPFYRYSNHAL